MTKKKTAAKAKVNQRTISCFFQPSRSPPEGGNSTAPDKPESRLVDPPCNVTVSKHPERISAPPELDENDPRWAALFRRVADKRGSEKKIVRKSMAEQILLWFDRLVNAQRYSICKHTSQKS